jgi:outer membrane protein TolC
MRSILGEYIYTAVTVEDAPARLAAARYDVVRLKEEFIATAKSIRALTARYEAEIKRLEADQDRIRDAIATNEATIKAVLELNPDLTPRIDKTIILTPAEGLS